MAATGRPAPFVGPWTHRAQGLDQWLRQHKIVASATTASLISTFAGFPLDSLKSRLQSSREASSIGRLAAGVVREEGLGGLWRGFPLPLITISIVRTVSFTVYTSTKRILNSVPSTSLISREQAENQNDPPRSGPSKQPWVDLQLNLFNKDTASDVALTSFLAGGASGAVVCVGSAPFELVKVRRQLEYQIYRDSHPQIYIPQPPEPHTSVRPPPSASLEQHPGGTSAAVPHHQEPPHPSRPAPFKPPTTMQAVRMIIQTAGYGGLYTGWRLHFIRDTTGTALYFMEYDVLRHWLGRTRADNGKAGDESLQGDVPDWARSWLPKGLIPFLCGSVAGVTSWALIYPVDAIKTKAQQRALSGLEPRTPRVQLHRLVRGTDKDNHKPLLMGMARLYRGLGVSMCRSMLTHGLLWTIVDWASTWIETKPFERLADGR